MKELLHRLSALDEDASAALKIITFFDTLLAQRAGLEPFVRGAAVLAGCPAGFAHPLHHIWLRVDADGHALPPVKDTTSITPWPQHELADGSGGVVWLERPGGPSAHDAVLLERLASCLHLTIERVSPLDLDDAGAIEILLSATSTDDARRKASRRLRLRDGARLRVVALPPTDDGASVPRSAVVATSYGPVRASIVVETEEWRAPRHGLGEVVGTAGLPRSWEQALLALRVSSRLSPEVRWDDLGALAALGDVDPQRAASHADVARLGGPLEPWVLDTLEAVTRSESVRAAAHLLGLHHSTVQARQAQLDAMLGFAVGSATGRTRVAAALVLHRLCTTRFDGPSSGSPS